MENNLKRVLDVRFHPSYQNEINKKIWAFAGELINHFLFLIEHSLPEKKWYMPNTSVLIINCSNFLDENFYNYTKIGEKSNGWMSEVRVRLNSEDFSNATEEEKIFMILYKIKEGFFKFFDLFPKHTFDKKIIDKVSQKIIDNNFFLQVSDTFVSRDSKYKIHLELFPKEKFKKYYLVFEENKNIEKFFLVDVYPPSMSCLGGWRYPIPKKWNKNKFYIDYNSSNEVCQIIFNAETKTIEYKK